MKNINIKELDNEQLLSINGGSEITDAIWYGIGYAFGWLAAGAGNSGSNVSPSGIQH
jgi:hypothetical protein